MIPREYFAAVLDREGLVRDASDSRLRIRAAGSRSPPLPSGSSGSRPRTPPDGSPRSSPGSRRYGPLITDEVGYTPVEHNAVNLFFQLVSSRQEYASPILISKLPFAPLG